jgi:hypothetical protein
VRPQAQHPLLRQEAGPERETHPFRVLVPDPVFCGLPLAPEERPLKETSSVSVGNSARSPAKKSSPTSSNDASSAAKVGAVNARTAKTARSAAMNKEERIVGKGRYWSSLQEDRVDITQTTLVED